ncbi:MAG: helicase-exonuclease AddAB subunit AddA [Planctomycetales bacterium 4572_13]|nr:MAG: helicase-exonuclease AddAB subunit AddA [Planctomycetales bacterium 4572_13]
MSKSENDKWTPAQQRAIETVGRSVLVTASAGTGKTAVLSHRTVQRMAGDTDAVRADAMLVLTFTDAAAEEMRSRIAETLYQRYLYTRDSRLRQQLLLLDRAYISTIHAFCKRILAEFFYLIDLDPAFGILDADEQRLLKAELLEDTLEDVWADKALAKDLESLFAGRRIQPGTGSFVDQIIPLAGFLDSTVNRADFYIRAATLNDHRNAAYAELKNAQKKILLRKLDHCRKRLDYAISLDARYCGGDFVTDYIRENYLPTVEMVRALLGKGRFDKCAEQVANFSVPNTPRFKKKLWDEDIKDVITQPIGKVRETLKALRDFTLLCPKYEQRLAPQVATQTKTLINLMQRFDTLYTAAKQRRNVLDFADLEHYALKLLQTHPETADKLKERFEYIFVDEYQDINAVQQRILEQVSRPDNVFVVGDVKQSIYGFRQSKPDIFLDQLENAGDGSGPPELPVRVDLQDNFRCRSEIIDFVNALFCRTMTRAVAQMDYDKRAELVSGFDYPAFEAEDGPAQPVELVLLNEDGNAGVSPALINTCDRDGRVPSQSVSAAQRQAAWVAERIQKIVGAQTATPEFEVYDKKTGSFRGVEYRDIVVLMRSLSHKAQDYTEMLRLAGVPVNSQSACGYFEATEVSDCLTLLKVLDNPDRDIELAGLLRSPVFAVTDTELAKIRLNAEKDDSFYRAVKKSAADGNETALAEKLNAILSQINAWRQQIRAGSLADFLDRVFREKGLLSFYAALPNGTQRRANLLKLHDHAIRFEHFRTTEPGTALGRFVEFLEKLDEAQQDWTPAEPASAGQNAVRIMSIHKSKGLEFPVVFVAELNTRFNMRDVSGACLIDEQMLGLQVVNKDASAAFASTAHQVIADQTRQKTIAEEMRILYVALTRAREKLILTGSIKQNACIKLLSQCAPFTDGLPEWKLSEARSHLDWVLAGFANQSPLHRSFETNAEGPLRDDGLFCPQHIGCQQLDAMTHKILNAKRSLKATAESPKPGSSPDKEANTAFEMIRKNIEWRYNFSDITQTPAKLSVSELTHRDDEFSAATVQRAFSQAPSVLQSSPPAGSRQKKPDAIALGSATHLVFEQIDLSGPVDAKVVQATLSRLVESGQLTEPLAVAIDIEGIVSFFDSELGQLARQAGSRVYREWPFTYGLDAAAVGATTNDEIVVLQGIIDMMIPTDEGLVVVDFKTDRVTEEAISERAEKYAGQMRSYATAAADILKQPVIAAWLHFLCPQKSVKINLD